MKKTLPLLAFAFALFCSHGVTLFAQNKTMGVGVETPNPNAILHVESPTANQGFIMPRLTTAQRTAPGFAGVLSAADNGLMVYDTNVKAIYIWDGASWNSTAEIAGGHQLVYPYKDSVTSLPDSATVFKIKYDGGVSAAVNVATFENTNVLNSGHALQVSTNGYGAAGIFTVKSIASSAVALTSATYGTGTALLVHHGGASGNVAVFSNETGFIARIDKTGKGFFDGGTEAGGADVAELFDVEGEATAYQPGDVLVISEKTDRTVEKSRQPNSTRVVGVYATKPGVLLTEKSIDDNKDNMVPMGVIGVIPTNVCNENGPIKRGDLIVTSSVPGHAMKAIPVVINGMALYPTGAIIGKALENFDGAGSGRIKVLVNVK